jgi:glyoxylate reductase
MSKPRVFLTRLIPEKGLKLIQSFCDVDQWTDELPPTYQTLLQRVRGIDGLLCLLTDRIDAAVMESAGAQLKVISNHAVGYDNIDIPAATSRSIPVGNTPGILTDATADFTFALLMAVSRRVLEGDRQVRDGGWKTWGPSILLGADFVGATLGIIGFGRIGKAVAERAAGFNLRVLYHDPGASLDPDLNAVPADLDTLLRQSDFITLHTPLTTETHHLINAENLAKMKSTAVLVNTSRGGVVDQTALFTALKDRRIFAAALDVTDPEPLPSDSPLLTLDNLIITPHIASASVNTRQQMSFMAANNLIAGLRGERLPNCVNPEVYRR